MWTSLRTTSISNYVVQFSSVQFVSDQSSPVQIISYQIRPSVMIYVVYSGDVYLFSALNTQCRNFYSFTGEQYLQGLSLFPFSKFWNFPAYPHADKPDGRIQTHQPLVRFSSPLNIVLPSGFGFAKYCSEMSFLFFCLATFYSRTTPVELVTFDNLVPISTYQPRVAISCFVPGLRAVLFVTETSRIYRSLYSLLWISKRLGLTFIS